MLAALFGCASEELPEHRPKCDDERLALDFSALCHRALIEPAPKAIDARDFERRVDIARRVFKTIDRDGDDKISLDEIYAFGKAFDLTFSREQYLNLTRCA
jgi:hypothetical protein